MGTGWRRAFCTTIPRDPQATTSSSSQDNHKTHYHVVHGPDDSIISPAPTPRSFSKLGAIFSGGLGSSSNPSTPRLRVKTTTRSSSFTSSTAATPVKKDNTPKLRCKTMPNTPTSKSLKIPSANHGSSNPSSPRSPFSIFKNSLRLSRNNCGVCMQSVKSGQKTAIFTSECSHSFHFPCISNHLRNQSSLFCPVCNAAWKDAIPLLSIPQPQQPPQLEKYNNLIIKTPTYNDDEPLISTVSSINSIPEILENDDEIEEFKGFFVNPVSSSISINNAKVETRLLPEVAIISTCQTHETYVVVLKIKAPPPRVNGVAQARRAPIDLVSVLDIGGSMTRTKLDMMKRAMHLVVSSLGSADRLSIIAFSATAKRLMPLKTMTSQGQRSARRVIDRLDLHSGSCAGDALRQATKILEDRRERNPVASVMLLSDGQDEQPRQDNNSNNRPVASHGSSTRFAHVEIPVHSAGYSQEPAEDAFAKCVGGLLSVVVQDLRVRVGFASGSDPAEICAVYPCNRPSVFSSGLIRIGDLYAEEERELLLELRVPVTSNEGHHVLSVCCSYKDPATQEIIHGTDQPLLVPKPQTFRSSIPKIQRLRNFFITTRAIAESRRLIELNEMSSAVQLLASSRELLVQSGCLGEEYVPKLEAELSEIRWRREVEEEVMQRRQRMGEEKVDRLPKVSCVKKSTKRVSDLHGFENARF
ncbi:hypothetical protein ACET3Z_020233 [Daucus carota]